MKESLIDRQLEMKQMKVLLVRNHDVENVNTRLPESLNKTQGIYPPLGLSYIASFLEHNGLDVEILDAKALNLTKEEIRESIRKSHPDIVGTTSMTPNCRGALEICRITKEISKDILTVIGGVQMSIFPKEMLSHRFVDAGVSGDGEYAMLELAKMFERGKKIPRLFVSRRVENLDSLPFPARHLLPNEKYWCVISEFPFTTLMTSRGCPFGCGFCYPLDKRVRLRSPNNVVDEIEEIVERYKFKEIMFYDDTFTISKKRAASICEEIISRKLDIRWETPTRVNTVDKSLLRLMKKAGCIRIRYGVESGDSEILKRMNKGITLQQAEDAFKSTKEVGIESFAYFIIGYIGETHKTMSKTISFAKKLNPDWAMFTVATPLPKTKLYEEAIASKLIDKNYWKEFTLGERNDRLPFLAKDAEKWVSRAYKEFYFRPSYIFKKLSTCDSLYRLKNNINGALGIVRFEMN
jgi:radical SAM superfamily enzyme YgiQ (UPF0313 family)